jgi:hypothetical protein
MKKQFPPSANRENVGGNPCRTAKNKILKGRAEK